MEPGYENYVIETADFETATGLIVNQNESTITVRGTMAAEKTIPRSEIVSMTTANLSLMPDELEKSMSAQELRDLLAFLKHEN
jgi:putative heme-binding domain-containing protein